VLDVLLALNSAEHIPMALAIDQAVKPVAVREPQSHAALVFSHAAFEVICHADLERSVWAVGHDVDPAGRHENDSRRAWLRNDLLEAVLRQVGYIRFIEVVGPGAEHGNDRVAAAWTLMCQKDHQ